ncbi:probable pectinesterase/pectinesterase inhibitor 12 [Impatiens glandulifera]|uniref:probable pectinesterase/pectinesterase inhibitor 12 n=1 Tax=Impatiens glandulifera TaxID=253017 RepID=UPI001FB13849|nr:probable pectinesterase/pectinesterase inhibitor 12 [Impatiens glandulifera]
MAASSSSSSYKLKLIFHCCSILFCAFLLLSTTTYAQTINTTTATIDSHISSIKSICKSTPYPDPCFHSLKLSISINISPNIITYLLQSLNTALSEALSLSNLLSTLTPSSILEKQRGALQDCKDLQQITFSSLKKSLSRINGGSTDSNKLSDARAFLSAALTNKNTCFEGLDSASGPMKSTLVNSFINSYKHISNSLSIMPKPSKSSGSTKHDGRRTLDISIGGGGDDDYTDDATGLITVAKDGTGNFSTIMDAINFAPNNSYDRIFIYIKEGIYEENVDIPTYKPNVVLLGDGVDVTVITGNRSVGDGWTTFRSATVAVSSEGFLARDITIQNTAGPAKHQAVALRINADMAAVYRCAIYGYQDSLYTHSFRQFYRECDISGTIDYIFGNAAVVFQGCNIISRLPMPGQYNVITAQSRESPDQDTGISIQNCSIVAAEDLNPSSSSTLVKSYLGRPWKVYSRTVYIESYIDGFIDPMGWIPWSWSDNQGLNTLYYGEYANSGPGSLTDNRVNWPGYHIMEYEDASNFTVSQFIAANEWLDSTSFPYDDAV